MTGLAVTVEENASRIILACLVLMGAVLVLAVGIILYRRWWLGSAESSGPSPWTLAELRRLREQGELTEEEYQSLRSAMLRTHGGDHEPRDASAPAADSGSAPGGGPDFDL